MKDYGRVQGIVSGGGKVTGHFDRQIFFPLTQEHLDAIEEHGTDGLYSTGAGLELYVDIDLDRYLGMLPELEGEIFFMLHKKRKAQKDVAKLLGLSQPTISYRYKRAMDKLSYLLLLASVNLRELIATIPQLNDKEKLVLGELFFLANQEMVGVKFGVRQSSVKWIFTKAKRYVGERELKEPELWHRQYSLFLLLEANLRKRIFC